MTETEDQNTINIDWGQEEIKSQSSEGDVIRVDCDEKPGYCRLCGYKMRPKQKMTEEEKKKKYDLCRKNYYAKNKHELLSKSSANYQKFKIRKARKRLLKAGKDMDYINVYLMLRFGKIKDDEEESEEEKQPENNGDSDSMQGMSVEGLDEEIV